MSIYTQRQANYGTTRNRRKPWQKCEICHHFDPDDQDISNRCRIVEGIIDPSDTCDFYIATETINVPDVPRQSFHDRLDRLNLPDYGE